MFNNVTNIVFFSDFSPIIQEYATPETSVSQKTDGMPAPTSTEKTYQVNSEFKTL